MEGYLEALNISNKFFQEHIRGFIVHAFRICKEMNPKLRILSVRRDPRQCWTIVRLEPVNLNLFSFEPNSGLEINISMMNHTPELRSLGPIGTVV